MYQYRGKMVQKFNNKNSTEHFENIGQCFRRYVNTKTHDMVHGVGGRAHVVLHSTVHLGRSGGIVWTEIMRAVLDTKVTGFTPLFIISLPAICIAKCL